METLLQSQMQNINSGYRFSISGLQRLLGQMSQMMVSILCTVEQHDTTGGLLMQLRGDEEDFRDKL